MQSATCRADSAHPICRSDEPGEAAARRGGSGHQTRNRGRARSSARRCAEMIGLLRRASRFAAGTSPRGARDRATFSTPDVHAHLDINKMERFNGTMHNFLLGLREDYSPLLEGLRVYNHVRPH